MSRIDKNLALGFAALAAMFLLMVFLSVMQHTWR